MANIADLVVSLSADIASFRDGMQQSKKAVSDLQSSFASAKEAASSFIEKIGEVVAAREVVKFLEDSAEATRGWADQLATFQGLAGLSSKEAATFAASAQLAGVQTDIVTTAMARLGTTIAQHPEKFQQLGISIRGASGQLLPMTEIMRNTIAGLDEFKAGTDRAAAAGYLFGRGAEAWIAQLDKLGPELQSGEWAQTSELVKSLSLSMDDAKAMAAEWAKAQGLLKLELLAFQNQVGAALLPVLKDLGAEILTLAKDGSFQRWGDAAGVVLKAVTTDAELAAKAIEFLMGLVKANADADVGVYDKLTGQDPSQRRSILKPWTPSPNGGFVPPDMRGSTTGLNAPSAGDATTPPDGTKTFNVPDAKQEQLSDSIATLTANLQRQTQQNQQLAAAMNQSGDAAKKLQDQFTALNKIDQIRAQALRDGITLTTQQVQSLTSLATAEGASEVVLQHSTQVHNDLTAAMKKQDDELQKLVDSCSLLSPKETEIADKEGLLWAAFNQGAISAQQFNDAIKQLQVQLNGTDQGFKEFTSGLSSDFSTLIGKATDFSELIANKDKNKKDTIFSQLTQDANEFVASLEKMLVKLAIVNPLLNSLGLGDQGNGKQLPTLFGSGSPVGGSAPGASSEGASPFTSAATTFASGGKSVLSFLGGLFGGTTAPTAAVDADADSMTGASLNSSIVDALSGGAFADGMAFAGGGDFTVGGSGGTDSTPVAFMATPGEHVSIMSEVANRGRLPGGNSGSRGGDIHLTQNISGVHSDTFRATKHQIMGDAVHAISTARRYSK